LQNAFSNTHVLHQYLRDIATRRSLEPALRYGRQYFRPCSEDGINFTHSPYNGGILAFSRILNDRDLLIVVITSVSITNTVHFIVDKNLNAGGKVWNVPFSR